MSSIFSTDSTFGIREVDENPAEDSSEPTGYDEHHDFLSFVNLVASMTEVTEWTALLMNTVHITPCNISLSDTRRHGSDFSVSLIERREFKRALPDGIAHMKLPKIIAVKAPILDRDFLSKRNRRIFSSMMREYQILSHKSLKTHENIISLTGCCWRTLKMSTAHVIPNLVFEGTSLGNLETFYRNFHQKISMRTRLGLCIDVAAGVEALHLAGVIHGDIKPQNILVFEDKRHRLVAKIADFGSSISVHLTEFPRKALDGTLAFAAPEIQQNTGGITETANFSKECLVKTDIFSLGITLWFSVRGPFVLDKISSTNSEKLRELKCEEKLIYWIDHDDQLSHSSKGVRRTFGKEAAEKDRQRLIWSWFEKQNDLRAEARVGSTSDQQDEFEEFEKGWRTITKDTLQSEQFENGFQSLVNQMTRSESSMRLSDMSCVVKSLQRILSLELHHVFYSNWRLRRQMKMAKESQSLLKVVLGESLPWNDSETPRLSHREVEAVTLSYSNYFRDLLFIWKNGNIAKFSQKNGVFPRVHGWKGKVLMAQR
ncbi:hypothetical protein VI817_009398 [Penicillium citrinum]|nr:hypothetical protein VI817_009398 [Penicillium citrinum]